MKKTLLFIVMTLLSLAIHCQPVTWQYLNTTEGECYSLTVHGNNEFCLYKIGGGLIKTFKGTATFQQGNTYTIIGKDFSAIMEYNDMGVLQYFRFFSKLKNIIANERKIPFIHPDDECDQPLGSRSNQPLF